MTDSGMASARLFSLARSDILSVGCRDASVEGYGYDKWVRQQVVKLACARHISTPFFIVIDADMFAVHPFKASNVFHHLPCDDEVAVCGSDGSVGYRSKNDVELTGYDLANVSRTWHQEWCGPLRDFEVLPKYQQNASYITTESHSAAWDPSPSQFSCMDAHMPMQAWSAAVLRIKQRTCCTMAQRPHGLNREVHACTFRLTAGSRLTAGLKLPASHQPCWLRGRSLIGSL